MENQQKINLFKVRDFGENFSVLFDFTKQNYKTILKGICYVIPVILIVAYLTMGLQTAQATDIYGILDVYFGWEVSLGLFASNIIGIIINAFVVCYMIKYTESENGIVDNSVVWNQVKRVIMPLIGYGIVYGLIVIIGSMLCLIPGLIVGIYLIFYSYVYVAERLSLIDSFKRSWELVKDNWFVIFGYLILIGIVLFLMSLVFSIPLYLRSIGVLFGADFFMSDTYIYIANLIANVGSTLLSPIASIGLGILYFSRSSDVDNIEINENIDLIGSIGND